MLFKDHFQKQLNSKIMSCTECKYKDNNGPLLGYGGIDADVMFIGDIVKDEDLVAGVPFTGIGKERFTEVINKLGFKRGEYYITYFIKHALGKNRQPSMLSRQPCMDLLLDEIEIINPRIICTMGYYATKYLTKEYKLDIENKRMKDVHGNSYIIPAKTSYNSRFTKKQDDRPKRYLVPTWSPNVDDVVMNKQMLNDIMMIGTVRNLGKLLFGQANVSR